MFEYKNFDKSELKTLDIEQFSENLPDLKGAIEPKTKVIANWLKEKIVSGLANKSISVHSKMPIKTDFAYLLGVSVGTVQNSIRMLEDMGYVESKQCLGTMVADYKNQTTSVRKLTSKREITVEKIKTLIFKNNMKVGTMMPSTRVLANLVGTSVNTTRLALEKLENDGILQFSDRRLIEQGWFIKTLNFSIDEFENATLVDKVEEDLKKFINENLKVGDKMPAHAELAAVLKVSIKTIHDGLKVLIDEGILLARRGRYGTSVLKMPNEPALSVKPEMSIFAPAQSAAFYHYERVQNTIRNLIAEQYEIGDKLPSIMDMSKQMDVSPNTVRKAFNNLAKEGILRFSRGRYGGTFVMDLPENSSEAAFKWLAVNPIYTLVEN